MLALRYQHLQILDKTMKADLASLGGIEFDITNISKNNTSAINKLIDAFSALPINVYTKSASQTGFVDISSILLASFSKFTTIGPGTITCCVRRDRK